MGKILAAALVAVIAIEPLRFNGERYKPGARVDGLTKEQSDTLIDMSHARTPTAEEGGPESSAEPVIKGNLTVKVEQVDTVKAGPSADHPAGGSAAPGSDANADGTGAQAAAGAETAANAAKDTTTAKPVAKTAVTKTPAAKTPAKKK